MLQPFQNAYEKYRTRIPAGAAWVLEQSQKEDERLSASGMPNRQDEDWKYTSLRNLTQENYHWDIFGDDAPQSLIERTKVEGAINLYMINGAFCPALSRQTVSGLKVMDLAEALLHRGKELQSFWDQFKGTPSDDWRPFEAVNRAFTLNGLYLHIAPRSVVDSLVHIIHIQGPQAHPYAVFPQVLVDMGESSQATIMESFVGSEDSRYFMSPVTWIRGQGNSYVSYTRMQQESRQANHIGSVRIKAERDARVVTCNIALGSALGRCDYHCDIAGSGAQVVLDGLFYAGQGQVLDNLTHVHHRVPHADSQQTYKGILNGSGRGIFTGKIKVYKNAQQTSALQVNKNLMLSTESEIDTRPQLEIDADDVKCSHGTATGRLNDDELFYLLSRGIPRAEAEHMLTLAFVNEIILKVDHPGAQAYVMRETSAVLERNRQGH